MRRFFNILTRSIKANPALAILSVTLTALYLALFVTQARIDISLQLVAPHSSTFRIYWAASDQAFNEKRMAYVQVNSQDQDYHFRIGSLARINRLRIDPIEHVGDVRLDQLNIQQFGYTPIKLRSKADFSPLIAQHQIEITQADTSSSLQIHTTGIDGNLEIALKPERRWAFPLLILSGLGLTLFALTLSGLTLLTRLLHPILFDLRFVPYLLSVSFVLALTMALTTGLNVHPDEVVHLSAVNYYASHILPPSLISPDIASSYSIYGHSRLSDFEIYYPLAGFFQAIPKWFGTEPLAGARAFGLVIFAWLIAFAFYQKKFRAFALPLLLSAQAWYIYAYTNSDAFALALVSFTAYLAASPSSALNRFLTEQQPGYYALKVIVFGALFGALLLLKPNYYFFILFLGLYLLWRIAIGDFPDHTRLWKRLLMLSLIAASLFGARLAMDIAANGWDSADIKAQMQERYAHAPYKPSAPENEKHPMVNLKSQGYSLGYILVNARWFEKSFRSAFGVYGFSDFAASKTYYDLVRSIVLLLLAALILATIQSRSRANLALLVILAICSGGMVAASIWVSWTNAFQPQGRYLLPALPMLSILYYHVRAYLIPNLLEWLSLILFLLAAYSFVFIGLANMNSLPG